MSLCQKRMRSPENYDGRDRLSEMPDEVIVHILSCMPIVDAVRTVLLRRFGNLWTLVHTLRIDVWEFNSSMYQNKNREFDDLGPYDVYDSEFLIFVRNVLMLHKRAAIHKFHLCLESLSSEYADVAVDDIKIWLRVALEKQAKEIEVFDAVDRLYPYSTILPNFRSQSLITLVLNHCEIEPQLQVSLGRLQKLSLFDCRMSDEGFQTFVSGCPSLQELTVVNPYDLKNLSFSAPKIDNLSLSLYDVRRLEYPFLLDCPNLKILDLRVFGLLPKVLDVSSVRHFILNYFHYNVNKGEEDDEEAGSEDEEDRNEDGDDSSTILDRFLAKFEAVEIFELSSYASEPFLHTIQRLSPLQNRWKRIILELEVFSQSCLSGICLLMSSLQHLEELIIFTVKGFKVRNGLVSSKHSSSSSSSSCVMPQLKTITLHGYVKSCNHQQQLVKSLLDNTPFFDKLVLLPVKQ